jgi:transcription elongation factor GreA
MSNKIYATKTGKVKMEEEFTRLKNNLRPKIVIELEAARAMGDLSENFEYHAAKDRLGLIDAKINDLEDKLARLEVVDTSKIDNSKVVFGTKVKLVNLETEDEVTYRIVGDFEADASHNEISINSPIAKALIGKKVGDEVTVHTPGGIKQFEVLEIEV